MFLIGCNCNLYVVKSGAKQSGTNLNIHMDVDFDYPIWQDVI